MSCTIMDTMGDDDATHKKLTSLKKGLPVNGFFSQSNHTTSISEGQQGGICPSEVGTSTLYPIWGYFFIAPGHPYEVAPAVDFNDKGLPSERIVRLLDEGQCVVQRCAPDARMALAIAISHAAKPAIKEGGGGPGREPAAHGSADLEIRRSIAWQI